MPAKPFVLAVRAVIFDEQGRCLLIRRSPSNQRFVGCWEWPGGKPDPGEEFTAAIIRETREETGLEIEFLALAGATQFEMPMAQVVLLCLESRLIGGQFCLSEEHDDFAWVSLGEISSRLLADQIRPFMLDYARRKGAGA